jgi:hypothetical protein
MLQFTAWNWYNELLNYSFYGYAWGPSWEDRRAPGPPLTTMKALIRHGASLHALSGSGHTILGGLILNLIQFDGYGRPPEVLASGLESWLQVVQDLGYSLVEYIQFEAAARTFYNLGLGLYMTVRFNEENAPHIRVLFQGSQERERNEFVGHISKCVIWKEWQRIYTLPKPPQPSRYGKLQHDKLEMVVIKECPLQDCPTSNQIPEIAQPTSVPVHLTFMLRTIYRNFIRFLYFVTRYRYEFTVYIAVFSWFAFGWVARF